MHFSGLQKASASGHFISSFVTITGVWHNDEVKLCWACTLMLDHEVCLS